MAGADRYQVGQLELEDPNFAAVLPGKDRRQRVRDLAFDLVLHGNMQFMPWAAYSQPIRLGRPA